VKPNVTTDAVLAVVVAMVNVVEVSAVVAVMAVDVVMVAAAAFALAAYVNAAVLAAWLAVRTTFGAESPVSHLSPQELVLEAAPLTVITMVVVAVPLLVKALVPALLVSVQPVCLAHAGDAAPVKLGSTSVIVSLTAKVTAAVNV
jgi:hypothetical protein